MEDPLVVHVHVFLEGFMCHHIWYGMQEGQSCKINVDTEKLVHIPHAAVDCNILHDI